MVRQSYTDLDKETALRLYRDKGWGYLSISKIIGCYPSTIKKWIEKSIGSGSDIKKHSSSKKSDSLKDSAIEEYLTDKKSSLRSVSKKYKISPKTLSIWITDSGNHVRKSVTLFDRGSILKCIEDGMSNVEISESHGCSYSLIYKIRTEI